jgi:hypothetical protein
MGIPIRLLLPALIAALLPASASIAGVVDSSAAGFTIRTTVVVSAAAGTLTWELAPAESGTSIVMTYAVSGYHPKGLGPMAPIFDRVLGRQMERLKSFLDTGKPESPEGSGK